MAEPTLSGGHSDNGSLVCCFSSMPQCCRPYLSGQIDSACIKTAFWDHIVDLGHHSKPALSGDHVKSLIDMACSRSCTHCCQIVFFQQRAVHLQAAEEMLAISHKNPALQSCLLDVACLLHL